MLMVNPSNYPAKQYCDIPTKVAVAKTVVVPVTIAVAVTVVLVMVVVLQSFKCCGSQGFGGLCIPYLPTK